MNRHGAHGSHVGRRPLRVVVGIAALGKLAENIGQVLGCQIGMEFLATITRVTDVGEKNGTRSVSPVGLALDVGLTFNVDHAVTIRVNAEIRVEIVGAGFGACAGSCVRVDGSGAFFFEALFDLRPRKTPLDLAAACESRALTGVKVIVETTQSCSLVGCGLFFSRQSDIFSQLNSL